MPIGTPWDDDLPPRVLAKGIIDLVLRTPQGWQIIDYKTDVLSIEQLVLALPRATSGLCSDLGEKSPGKELRLSGSIRCGTFS